MQSLPSGTTSIFSGITHIPRRLVSSENSIVESFTWIRRPSPLCQESKVRVCVCMHGHMIFSWSPLNTTAWAECSPGSQKKSLVCMHPACNAAVEERKRASYVTKLGSSFYGPFASASSRQACITRLFLLLKHQTALLIALFESLLERAARGPR